MTKQPVYRNGNFAKKLNIKIIIAFHPYSIPHSDLTKINKYYCTGGVFR